jgi:inositol 1,4,5-triphosphate receptor type 1
MLVDKNIYTLPWRYYVQLQNVLREEIKDKFKYEVDRSSPSNKIRDFMDWASDIIHDIQYQRKIHAIPIARLMIKLWYGLLYAYCAEG